MSVRHTFIALLCLLLAGTVSAAIVIPPPDLNPGDQYRLAFITSGTRDATSTDIADYNSFVNAQAALVSATGFPTSGWAAIASTESVDARDNTGTNPSAGAGVPIYRVDGVRIADDYADLWDGGRLAANLSVTQQGDPYPNTVPPCASFPYCLAWTGTSSLGTAASPLGGPNASSAAGDIFQEDTVNVSSWILGYFDTRSRLYPLYAMSAVLTVPSGPPPGSTYTVGGSISGLAGTVTLQNNGGDNLVRSANGSFTFATALADSSAYSVTVIAQPSGQTCSVNNGSGTISGADVTDVAVECVDASVPPSPGGPAQIPTLSLYGLVLTIIGLLVIAGGRLRQTANRR
jgi:hypothetical protein